MLRVKEKKKEFGEGRTNREKKENKQGIKGKGGEIKNE